MKFKVAQGSSSQYSVHWNSNESMAKILNLEANRGKSVRLWERMVLHVISQLAFLK